MIHSPKYFPCPKCGCLSLGRNPSPVKPNRIHKNCSEHKQDYSINRKNEVH